VIQTMKTTKLKVLAAVVLAVGAVGGGVGWLTYRVGGAEPPAPRAEARTSAAPLGRSEPEGARVAAEEQAKQLDKAVDDAKARERALRDMEDQWLEELIQARRRLMVKEESLQALEREQAEARERERGDRNSRAARIRELEARIEEVAATSRDPEKQIARLREELGVQIEVARKVEAERSRALLHAREELMVAEEQLRLLERRQAAQRARLQVRLEVAEERVQRLQGEPARRDAPDRRLAEVEGKLDQVLRELAELRRDLRHPPGDGPRPAPKPREPAKP
jgi:hypothetical protein